MSSDSSQKEYFDTLLQLLEPYRITNISGLAKAITDFKRKKNIVDPDGTSQPSLSKAYRGQKSLSEATCRVIGEFVSEIIGRPFKFPKDIHKNQSSSEKRSPNETFYDDAKTAISKKQTTQDYLEGCWNFFFRSRRDSDTERMIRKAALIFCSSSSSPHMEVISIGESTVWQGTCEEVEGYVYVDLQRCDLFIEKMYVIFRSPNHWNQLLEGQTLGIQGRKGGSLHPIISTKFIAFKSEEAIDIDLIFNGKKIDLEELVSCREKLNCGYIHETDLVGIDALSDIDVLDKINNSVQENDLPFVLKTEPM